MPDTNKQYDQVVAAAAEIFLKKTQDYGTAWRVLRPISIVDQIFIKAQRIRTIQELGEQRAGDGVADEFKGIINYAVIGLLQLQLKSDDPEELSLQQVQPLYENIVATAKQLMQNKNHDYGEAWRDMRISSLTDLIIQKLLRVKQIEDNKGKTLVSEGIDANYQDMINYSVFALILMENK